MTAVSHPWFRSRRYCRCCYVDASFRDLTPYHQPPSVSVSFLQRASSQFQLRHRGLAEVEQNSARVVDDYHNNDNEEHYSLLVDHDLL